MYRLFEKYNDCLLNYQYENLPLGLMNGEMGLCVYWFLQGKVFSNKVYMKHAMNIFMHVCERIGQGTNVGSDNNLVGVGFGVSLLVDRGYIRADLNDLLHEIDEKIFQFIYYGYICNKKKANSDYVSFLWCLIYLCSRLEHGAGSKKDGVLYKHLLVEGINNIEENMRDESFQEPISFSPYSFFLPLYIRLLNHAYVLNIHSDKIRMIFKELEPKICSNIPFNEGNRIVLYGEIAQMLQILDEGTLKQRIIRHKDILQKSLDVKSYIHNGLRSKQLLINNGLSGLLLYIKSNRCCVNLMPNQKEIEEKLKSSPIIASMVLDEHILNTDVSLATGITGVIYTYEYCYW